MQTPQKKWGVFVGKIGTSSRPRESFGIGLRNRRLLVRAQRGVVALFDAIPTNGGMANIFTENAKMPADRHAGGRPRTLPYSELGERIVAQANRRGVHLDEIAANAGISYPTLSRIMSGRIASPRMSTVCALADALGLKPEKLIVPQKRRTG